MFDMVCSKMSFGAHQSSKWCAPKPRTVRTTPSKPMQQYDGRCVLATVGKREFGLYGVVSAMTVIALAAYTNIMLCGGIPVGRNIWQV